MTKLTKSETLCLRVIAEAYKEPEHCVLFYSHIMNYTLLNQTQARRAVRSLARKGLVEHQVAFDCDDGKVMGSGYIATFKGIATAGELPSG